MMCCAHWGENWLVTPPFHLHISCTCLYFVHAYIPVDTCVGPCLRMHAVLHPSVPIVIWPATELSRAEAYELFRLMRESGPDRLTRRNTHT